MPTIFLNVGATSFADPTDWDPANNKVECLGSGYRGGAPYDYGPELLDPVVTPLGHYAGGGGGGGGYGYATNLAPVFPVAIHVAAQSTGGTGTYFAGPTDTFWQSYTAAAGNVCGGNGSLSSVNGQSGGGFYPQGFSGAAGLAFSSTTGNPGGGAAGPHGAGAGGSPTTYVGGTGDGGQAPGGAQGAAGGAGGGWDASHRCGGGGGGGSTAQAGPAGGTYGGGGGGSGGTATGITGNASGDGLLVITYTSFVPPKGVNITVMA